MHPHPTDIVPNLFGAHRVQDELVAALRSALVGGRLGRARDLLRRVDGKLRRHFTYEEELLLPTFEARLDSEGARGASELIATEHRWVEAFLEQASALIADLGPCDEGRVDRVLALADVVARMEHVLEHHDRREDEAFNPVLDDILEHHERTHVLGTIAGREILALQAELGVAATDEVLPPFRLPFDAIRAEPAAANVPETLGACQARVRSLRYMLATDDAERLPAVIEGVRAMLAQAERLTVPLADRSGDARLRKLVTGQHSKMQMLLGRCSAKVAEGLAQQEDGDRWGALVEAYDAASSLAGLLDNHAGAVLERLA